MKDERQKEIQIFRVELDEKTTSSDHKKNRIKQKIKSIILSRSSNPNIIITCKLLEGDEFVLTPGRVVNFNTPTNGVVFSWESYPYEWAEFEISENEHLVPFTPQSSPSIASNVASKVISKFINDLEVVGLGVGPIFQKKILDSNPNRVKAIVESYCMDRVFVGTKENTDQVNAYDSIVEKNEYILPLCVKEFNNSDELYVICDESSNSITGYGGGPISGYLKVTEYIK